MQTFLSWLRAGKEIEVESDQQPRGKPGVVEALRALLQEDFDETEPISRVEIRIMATGEVVYRLHPASGDEYVGGVATVRDRVA